MMSRTMTSYSKNLKLRGAFKKLQQIIWSIGKLEKRHDLDTLTDPEIENLNSVYIGFIPEVDGILSELKALEKEVEK